MEKWLGVPPGTAIPSWVSDWDFQAPDFIRTPLKERIEHGVFGYSERSNEYFASVVDWFADRHQVNIDRDWFHTTPGSLPAIAMLIESWSQPGDSVLVMLPVYHAFFRTIENTNRTLKTSALINNNGYYTIDFADLEDQFRKGVLDSCCFFLFSPCLAISDERFPNVKWNHFYIGASLINAHDKTDIETQASSDVYFRDEDYLQVPAAASGSVTSNSVRGGLHAGWNWNTGTILYGLEAD